MCKYASFEQLVRDLNNLQSALPLENIEAVLIDRKIDDKHVVVQEGDYSGHTLGDLFKLDLSNLIKIPRSQIRVILGEGFGIGKTTSFKQAINLFRKILESENTKFLHIPIEMSMFSQEESAASIQRAIISKIIRDSLDFLLNSIIDEIEEIERTQIKVDHKNLQTVLEQILKDRNASKQDIETILDSLKVSGDQDLLEALLKLLRELNCLSAWTFDELERFVTSQLDLFGDRGKRNVQLLLEKFGREFREKDFFLYEILTYEFVMWAKHVKQGAISPAFYRTASEFEIQLLEFSDEEFRQLAKNIFHNVFGQIPIPLREHLMDVETESIILNIDSDSHADRTPSEFGKRYVNALLRKNSLTPHKIQSYKDEYADIARMELIRTLNEERTGWQFTKNFREKDIHFDLYGEVLDGGRIVDRVCAIACPIEASEFVIDSFNHQIELMERQGRYHRQADKGIIIAPSFSPEAIALSRRHNFEYQEVEDTRPIRAEIPQDATVQDVTVQDEPVAYKDAKIMPENRTITLDQEKSDLSLIDVFAPSKQLIAQKTEEETPIEAQQADDTQKPSGFSKYFLPASPLRRLLKGNRDIRISSDAVIATAEFIAELNDKVFCPFIAKLVSSADRRTITAEDILSLVRRIGIKSIQPQSGIRIAQADRMLRTTGFRSTKNAKEEFTLLLNDIVDFLGLEAFGEARKNNKRTIRPDEIEAVTKKAYEAILSNTSAKSSDERIQLRHGSTEAVLETYGIPIAPIRQLLGYEKSQVISTEAASFARDFLANFHRSQLIPALKLRTNLSRRKTVMTSDIQSLRSKLALNIKTTPNILKKAQVNRMLQELGDLKVSSDARRSYFHLLESILIEIGNLAVEGLIDDSKRLEVEEVNNAAQTLIKRFKQQKTTLKSFF